MINTITDIVSIITVAQFLLFTLFLFIANKRRSPDKTALALFLLANSFHILNFLAFRYNGELVSAYSIFFVGNTFSFLFGPLLYLYTKAVTSNNFHFSAKDILHLIPFTFALLMSVALYLYLPYEIKYSVINNPIYESTGYATYFIFLQAFTLTYLLITFQLARKKNKKLKSYFSSIEKINFEWLKLVITAFCVMWIVDIINLFTFFLHISTRTSMGLLNFISILINFIFANLLILKNLRLPQVEVEQGNEIEKHKYESSPLTTKEKTDILSRLENLMTNEKLYLNSSLNLGETARHLNIAPRYLSQVINELKDQNFYDYVNHYRIDEAKRFLTDPNHEDDKIISVQFDCGFNSKSAFNTVFKKLTGVTPSEYRRTNRTNNYK